MKLSLESEADMEKKWKNFCKTKVFMVKWLEKKCNKAIFKIDAA